MMGAQFLIAELLINYSTHEESDAFPYVEERMSKELIKAKVLAFTPDQ